jgi:hypothetical protein
MGRGLVLIFLERCPAVLCPLENLKYRTFIFAEAARAIVVGHLASGCFKRFRKTFFADDPFLLIGNFMLRGPTL